jgi:hypothetical protein
MRLAEVIALLRRGATALALPGMEPDTRALTEQMGRAADALTQGDLDLPWTSESGQYKVDQPITDLPECGTPIDPDEGDDLVLDLPIPATLSEGDQ